MVSDEFASAIVALAEAYNTLVSKERIEIYAAALSDVSIQDVRNAMLKAVRQCKFFPTVAELRSYLEPSTDDAALVSWSGFQQAAREVGSYGSLDVEDHCAGEALLAVFGSWPVFCQTEEGPELGAKKAEFVAAYRQARRQATLAPTVMFRLLGVCQLENQQNGGGPVTWVGRLSLSGKVKAQRDQAALPSSTQKALPE